ncbi:MAG: hypothetical protein HZB53_20025 [Chloroflexi bacterium]|nr:hypothetical protein [Chloroflexota bacterium]
MATIHELARQIAARTGDMRAADVLHSSAPQLRYDFIAGQVCADSALASQFTAAELAAIVAAIADSGKRAKAARDVSGA